MVTSASSYAGAYVFSHSDGEWIEEERANALVPIAAEVVVGSETATPTVSALLAVPAAFEFVEMNTLRA